MSFTIMEEYCFGPSVPTSSKGILKKLFSPFLLLTFFALINIKTFSTPLLL